MALAIVLCHSRGRVLLLNDTALGSLLTALAYLVVGMFFFLTGYGLCESVSAKPAYKDRFLQNRIIPYYADCLVFILLYTLYRWITGANVTVMGVVGSATVFNSYVLNGWYLQVALLVYLSFWLAWRFDKKYEWSILCGLLVAYVVVCIVIDAPMTRTQSILGIPLGVIWSVKKLSLDMALRKYGWLILCGSFVLTIAMVIVGSWYVTGLLQLAVKAMSTVFFIVFCLCVLRYIPIQCSVTAFLGSISLEIYVVHGLFIEVFGHNADTWGKTGLFLFAVFSCSILSAWILHFAIKNLNGWLKKVL